LNQQARLNEIRGQLEQQLVRLDGKDPQHLAELDNIYKNLFGDPNAAHAAFLQAAAAAKADSQQLMAKALKDAASRSETSALQMAQGLSIIDPDQNLWDLANWPVSTRLHKYLEPVFSGDKADEPREPNLRDS